MAMKPQIQVTGLEPAIYRLKAGCHTTWLHLHTAHTGPRTRDLPVKSRLLFQLSYMHKKTAYPLGISGVTEDQSVSPGGANDFHPVPLTHNGITNTRCFPAHFFCCFWLDTEFIMVVMAFLLSLNLYVLIIAARLFVVNLLVVDKKRADPQTNPLFFYTKILLAYLIKNQSA